MQDLNEKERIQAPSDILSSKDGRQHNVHATMTKKIVFWLYLIIELIFITILIILLSLSWQPFEQFRQSDNFYYANQVTYSWSQGLIKDIHITSASVCPAGFQHAISFDWPGIGFGCYCQSGANISLVLQGYCSPSLIQTGCRNMPDQNAKVAHFWKNQSNICIQRSSVSFENEQKYNGNNKICGSSSSLIIVPNDQPCPIVNVSFTAFALENHTFTATDTEHKLNTLHLVFNSTSPYSFYAYPISHFAVSEFQFCLMDQDTGKDPQHSDFILLNQLRGCVDLGNYTTLDSMNEIDFYANNPQLQTLTTLTGFPQPSNWEYLMGFKHFSGWTYRCRHNYDNKFSIKNAKSLFNFDFYDTYNGLYIPIVIFIGVIGLQILVLIIRRIVNSSIYPIGYKQQYLLKQFLLALIRYIIDFICKIVLISLYFAMFWISYYNWHWFKGAMNFNCFDNDINTRQRILIPFTNLYFIIYTNSLSPLILIIFMLILDTAHFIFVYKKQLSHYLVSPQGKMLIKSEQNQDIKWLDSNQHLNIKENALDGLQNNNPDEQFRITMAQNIWMDDAPVEKIKKKKKKKFKPFKKQKDDDEEKKEIAEDINRDDIFNPYELEEPPVFNSDTLNFESLQQSNSPKKRRRK